MYDLPQFVRGISTFIFAHIAPKTSEKPEEDTEVDPTPIPAKRNGKKPTDESAEEPKSERTLRHGKTAATTEEEVPAKSTRTTRARKEASVEGAEVEADKQPPASKAAAGGQERDSGSGLPSPKEKDGKKDPTRRNLRSQKTVGSEAASVKSAVGAAPKASVKKSGPKKNAAKKEPDSASSSAPNSPVKAAEDAVVSDNESEPRSSGFEKSDKQGKKTTKVAAAKSKVVGKKEGPAEEKEKDQEEEKSGGQAVFERTQWEMLLSEDESDTGSDKENEEPHMEVEVAPVLPVQVDNEIAEEVDIQSATADYPAFGGLIAVRLVCQKGGVDGDYRYLVRRSEKCQWMTKKVFQSILKKDKMQSLTTQSFTKITTDFCSAFGGVPRKSIGRVTATEDAMNFLQNDTRLAHSGRMSRVDWEDWERVRKRGRHLPPRRTRIIRRIAA